LECGGQPPLWDHVGAIICAKIYDVPYSPLKLAMDNPMQFPLKRRVPQVIRFVGAMARLTLLA
jgi:hypothetical protein